LTDAREWSRGDFRISTDPNLLDIDVIHGFLKHAYWSVGIPREIVERSIDGSLCFGIYDSGRQVGFARVITDCATFGYLADVFVLESHRGRGLSKWLMQCILAHPDLQGLRRWRLVTSDAHGLYAQFGFTPIDNPERHMEKLRTNPYGEA
jgi:N-acetylglutamate synthase-like GNAT family acetyltransferase